MWNGKLLSLGIVLCLVRSADAAEPSTSGPLDWLEEKGVEMRKSFSGTSRDSADAASLSYVNGDDGDDFYNIDLAVKLTSWNWDNEGNLQGRLYPVIEYHQRTQASNRVDTTSAGVVAELERSLGDCYVSGISIDFCTAIFADIGFQLKRDSQNNKTIRSASLLTGLTGKYSFWPTKQISLGRFLEFTYLPIVGIEHYETLPIEQKIDGEVVTLADAVDETFQSARLNVALRPFHDELSGRLVIVLNQTHRWLLGSSDAIDNHTHFSEAALNFFLDDNRRIALGFTYSNGESPARNFLDEEVSSIALKIKL